MDSHMETTKKRVIESEDRIVEISQDEEQRKIRLKNMKMKPAS